jgi:hypothetical protein
MKKKIKRNLGTTDGCENGCPFADRDKFGTSCTHPRWKVEIYGFRSRQIVDSDKWIGNFVEWCPLSFDNIFKH